MNKLGFQKVAHPCISLIVSLSIAVSVIPVSMDIQSHAAPEFNEPSREMPLPINQNLMEWNALELPQLDFPGKNKLFISRMLVLFLLVNPALSFAQQEIVPSEHQPPEVLIDRKDSSVYPNNPDPTQSERIVKYAQSLDPQKYAHLRLPNEYMAGHVNELMRKFFPDDPRMWSIPILWDSMNPNGPSFTGLGFQPVPLNFSRVTALHDPGVKGIPPSDPNDPGVKEILPSNPIVIIIDPIEAGKDLGEVKFDFKILLNANDTRRLKDRMKNIKALADQLRPFSPNGPLTTREGKGGEDLDTAVRNVFIARDVFLEIFDTINMLQAKGIDVDPAVYHDLVEIFGKQYMFSWGELQVLFAGIPEPKSSEDIKKSNAIQESWKELPNLASFSETLKALKGKQGKNQKKGMAFKPEGMSFVNDGFTTGRYSSNLIPYVNQLLSGAIESIYGPRRAPPLELSFFRAA
jgi:hypothetical protein